ncbi:MAG: carboxypeptidase-like regulatory domain-containing protein [Bacteroidota bacterium]
MKQILLLLFLLFSSIYLNAQQGKVSGIIIDPSTEKAIPQVVVQLNELKTTTDANGYFEISNVPYGERTLLVNAIGFETYTLIIKVNSASNNLKISLTPVASEEGERKGISEVNLSTLDLEDDNKGQSVSGLLHSSGDVFTSTASYVFGQEYFRTRGYDSDNSSVYMSGINVNDAENGRPSFSEWGGLNDATSNKEIISGINPSRFSFGAVGGATNISTRASLQRKQFKVSYSLSDKTYTNRVSLTYSTGLMKNNWAFTVSASRRWGSEGYVQGIFYDANSYFVSIEKKFNNSHSIGLTAYGAPTKRGMQAGAVQEAYDLTNNKYYNPNWGYQNGEVRNARVKDSHEPMIILSDYLVLDSKTKLTTSLGYSFGYSGNTALNWYNASDPRPDYYRYLPSWQTDANAIAVSTNAWQTNQSISQLNWNKLYQINYLANYMGTQANYIVEERRNDQNQFSFSTLLNKEVNKNVRIDGGLEVKSLVSHNFKVLNDLLGGNYWVDIDQFAQQDFIGDTNKLQNDLNNPNRKINVGDKFGYDYDMHVNSGLLWAQTELTSNKLDYFFAGNLSATSFWRHGNMMNGRYPTNSYGDSKVSNFIDGGLKGGATYKINGRNFIVANADWSTRAPYEANSFVSPRTKNELTPDIKSEKIEAGDISYIARFPAFKLRLTVFQTMFQDQSEIRYFYDDDLATFVNYVMTGVSKTHQGIEFGAEIKASQRISITTVASLGNYRYTSRPTATISYDNGSQADVTKTVYMKNFYVAGTPQSAMTLGLNYRHPKNYFVNLNLNYYAGMYLDFNPDRRTSAAVANMDPSDPLIASIVNQQKLPNGSTVDASVGKSWTIKGIYYSINLSVSNVLDNKDIVTGGYEQMRFDYTNKDLNKFPPKYFYGFGRTYFLNLSVRF